MDGLSVSGVLANPVTFLRTTSSSEQLALSVDDGNVIFDSYQDESGRYGGFVFQGTENGVGTRKRMEISHTTGDISFYEDTGSTAKLFWDSSAESLGIGTTSPTTTLDISHQISSTGIEYPLLIAGIDAGNTINQDTTSGIGLQFKLAGNTSAGDSFAGASIVAMRENASDADSSTGLAFLTSQNDTTLDEAIRINSSGNVGIGTSSPADALHVNSGSTNEVARFQSTDGTAYISIMDNSTSNSVQGIGSVGNNLTLYANNAERMRIDSSGNLLVGKTSASSATVGFQAGQNGFIAATRASGQPLVLNRTTNDGIIADFRKDGTVVGSIDSSSGGIKQVSAANYTVDATGDITLDADGGDIFFKDGGSAALSLNMGSVSTAEFETSRSQLKFDCAGRFVADSSDGSGTHRFDINFNSGNDLFETLQISNPSASVVSIAVQCEDNDTVLNFNSQSGQYTFCRSSGDVNFSIDTSSSGPIFKAEESCLLYTSPSPRD